MILYIIGFINWYEGKDLIYLINFILSFLFFSLYLKQQDTGIAELLGTYENNEKLQGVFYIMFFCLILIVGISAKSKGVIYIISYIVLFLCYGFLFALKFFKNDIIAKIDGYIFIVTGAFFWIIGILRLLNSYVNCSIKFLEPSD